MKDISLYRDALDDNQFRIDYPYYGLFGSAVITPMCDEEGIIYRCRLLNGNTIFLKKNFQTKKWIDAGLHAETPLSATIGLEIDDFLKTKKGA